MKTILSIFQSFFSMKSYDKVCNSCSYYDDRVIDDHSAFIPHITSKRGWISKYMKEKLQGK